MNKIILSIIYLSLFNLSTYANPQGNDIFNHFANLGVPQKPLSEVLEYFNENEEKFLNKKYISIIDYSQKSSKKRFYIMNIETGELQTEYVAHGSGRNRIGFPIADLNNDGRLDRCKHSKFSKRIRLVKHRRWGMTRPGFIRVDGTYHSVKFAYDEYKKSGAANALLLTGLEASSSDVRRNAVVIHEAWYVQDKSRKQGKTLGCPAVARGRIKTFIDKIKGGSLLYSYVPQCK